MSKLVCGIGINDADYATHIYDSVDGKQRQLWRCPFYKKWKGMIERCYSIRRRTGTPAYNGVSVCEEWLRFSSFKPWMENQAWDGKQLDKDLLIKGNKVYGPDACVLISPALNSFILDNLSRRGELPIGVYYDKRKGRYTARCGSKDNYIGSFGTPEEAHEAWKMAKWKLAQDFISIETDQRIIDALVSRYKVDVD